MTKTISQQSHEKIGTSRALRTLQNRRFDPTLALLLAIFLLFFSKKRKGDASISYALHKKTLRHATTSYAYVIRIMERVRLGSKEI